MMLPHLTERQQCGNRTLRTMVSLSLGRYGPQELKKKETHFRIGTKLEDVMRCDEGAGFLKGCRRSRTMLSLAGRSCLPVASPTAGPSR